MAEEDTRTDGPMEALEESSPRRTVTLHQVLKDGKSRRAFLSAVPTLTLGIIGGAVLPLAWAFSVTGIIAGVLIMLVVAAANAYTSDLLLRQAHVTSTYDYENLAFVIGGKWWKLVTEISIVVLLVGSLVGGMSQIGEVGTIGLTSIWENLPTWLVGSHGRLIITFSVLFIIGPLCLVNKLSQLEYAGIFGTCIVLWLMVTVVVNSVAHGLPAIRSKAFALVGFNSIGDVTQAVSIFGFAFYIQPIMMPLLEEVPNGLVGVKIVSYSTRITILVNAFLIYFFTGFFGAAYYGKDTASDILENQWLGGGVSQGILNISMAVYLSLANPVLEFPTRHTIEGWIPKGYLGHGFSRHLAITTLILGFSLAVALALPNSSANILVVTGATGVCMVSYLIPIINHFLLHYNKSKIQNDDLGGDIVSSLSGVHGDLEKNKIARPPKPLEYRRTMPHSQPTCLLGMENMRDVLLPMLVLGLGLFCSIASLSTLGQN